MRVILGALVAVLLASTATAQTTIEQRNQWRRQAAEYEATAAGLRLAARCEMPDFPSGWTYRKEVAPTAAPGSTLTNIPVAVTISADSDIAANALANGHDVLFTDLTDGTTVYPSWRASYSAGTWKGFVLFPSFSSGDKCYVNYGNADASDQSTTAALTGGGITHWLNFQATDVSSLTGLITGVSAAPSGGTGASSIAGPFWNAWRLSPNCVATFGAGEFQPAEPYTRVIRCRGQQFQLGHFASYGTGNVPRHFLQVFSWTLATGNTGSGTQTVTLSSNTWQTISSSCPSGGPSAVYNAGALVNGNVTHVDGYNGVLKIGGTTTTDIAEYAYFSGTRDANWHAFWHANTGTVSLSAQEEVVIPSAADLSVTDSRRYNLSVTDSARYNLTVADTLATDLTLGQEPTD